MKIHAIFDGMKGRDHRGRVYNPGRSAIILRKRFVMALARKREHIQ